MFNKTMDKHNTAVGVNVKYAAVGWCYRLLYNPGKLASVLHSVFVVSV